MPLNLRSEDIELLWLIQPNLANDQELEIKKKFDKPSVSMDINDLMYITISSDFDYIYKLNASSSSYRCNSNFFVFKVSSDNQAIQDFLVLKLNEDIDLTIIDSFMCFILDYTDFLDLESASFKDKTLKKIFLQFKRKETCIFNKDEIRNKQDVLNSLNFHHDVYVDKDKADMIANGGQAIGNGIVSLARMASNIIETIGNQIETNYSKKQENNESQTETSDSIESSNSSSNCSEDNVDEKEKQNSNLKKEYSRRHHRHHRHSKKNKREYEENNKNDEESSTHRHSRKFRRQARRAANIKKLNEFTKSFSQVATIAATAISTAITETASYVVPAVEEYLPSVISQVTNYDEETSRKMVGSTLGYGKVALNAMDEIKNSVSEGFGIIGTSVANQTTQIVKSKYGEEIAEETSDAMEIAGNLATTYTKIKKCKKII